MKHLKINSRLLKLDKVYLIYVLALAFSSPLFAQSAQYYVLVNKSKLASGCTVDTDFTTFRLSTKMKSEQRNKIIEVYEKRLNPSEDRSIRKFELYVSNTDYVIVYEYIFKSESCPSKTFKYIKAFKASSKEKAYKALQKRIAESFTYDRYISHKILLETQPFADSATLLNKAAQLLREYQQDSIKEARRAAAMGGRG
jgi:hypothetical protein